MINIKNIIKEEVLIEKYLSDSTDEGLYLLEMDNKTNLLSAAIARLNQTTAPQIRTKLAGMIVAILATVLPFSINTNDAADKLAKEDVVTIEKAKQVVSPADENASDYSDPTKMKLSDKGKQLIKKHEGLRLKAYDIGDGKITIGYGHAEPKGNSRYQLGQEISQQEADRLFDQDISKFEEAIRRMFRQWETQRDNEVFISQGMFDALVSMAYNMGVSRLRNSEFIEKLEYADDPKDVAELIKSTALKTGFSGLIKRRNAEYQHFVSDV